MTSIAVGPLRLRRQGARGLHRSERSGLPWWRPDGWWSEGPPWQSPCPLLRLWSREPSRTPTKLRAIGGEKVYTKVVFSSENSSSSTGKREVWCIPKSLFSREKKENTYTPKRLQGVCGGPLRGVLVYRFWPPKIKSDSKVQGRKRNPNPNFLVRISSGGVGVFRVNGWGPKKFGMSFETQGNQTFGRDVPGFCRDIPELPEKFEKRKFVFNFWPIKVTKKWLSGFPPKWLKSEPRSDFLTPQKATFVSLLGSKSHIWSHFWVTLRATLKVTFESLFIFLLLGVFLEDSQDHSLRREEKWEEPLNRLNAVLSLLQPLDRYSTSSVIGSAIGRPYLAPSRIHAQVRSDLFWTRVWCIPEFGAGLKVPFSRIFSFFLQFWGFEGEFKTCAEPRYAPNSGWNAFREEFSTALF